MVLYGTNGRTVNVVLQYRDMDGCVYPYLHRFFVCEEDKDLVRNRLSMFVESIRDMGWDRLYANPSKYKLDVELFTEFGFQFDEYGVLYLDID